MSKQQIIEQEQSVSTAQMLLEKITAKSKNKTTFAIEGESFTFFQDATAYDRMLNDMEADNKITPMKDYLLAIIEPAQKETFAPLLQVPGLAMTITAKVNAVLIPQVEISIKN